VRAAALLVAALGAAGGLGPVPRARAQDADAPPAAALDLGNARHVRAVYLDLLGRTPDADELELARASRPDVLLRLLCGSREFWDHWYEDELYFFLLIDNARPSAAPGEDGLPARLAAGKLGVLDAEREIVTSSAFNRANPGNDTFVSVVFEQLLGLRVQDAPALLQAGKQMYDGQPATLFGERGSSQADVVAIVTRQPGFAERFVQRQYRRLVGAPPSRPDVTRWAAALRRQADAFPALAAEWLSAPAYAERLQTLRPKTDTQFIRGLYVDLTGARPEPDQLQRLRGALGALADTAPLRAVIARSLLDQQADRLPRRGEVEGEAFVRRTFERYLGREPSHEELEDFLLIYGQEDCQPATVVRAIVTHWEYQYY
jgi:hypothetical protein